MLVCEPVLPTARMIRGKRPALAVLRWTVLAVVGAAWIAGLYALAVAC